MEQTPSDQVVSGIERQIQPQAQAAKPNKFFEREYIDSLKEDVVKDILVTILRRVGNTQIIDRFIPFKDILTINNLNIKNAGTYDAEPHEIELNKYHLLIGEKEWVKTMTLSTIIHEELHAITNRNTAHCSLDLGDTRQTGFQVETLDAITRASLGKVWKDFNEGITELIKDDILDEYVRRTGDRKGFHIEGYELGLPESTYQTYLPERALVNVVINRVATDSGVSKDAVREAFVQAYFSGTPLDDIKKDLIAISGEELVAKIDTGVIVIPKGVALEKVLNQKEEDEKNMGILVRLCTNFMKRSLVG